MKLIYIFIFIFTFIFNFNLFAQNISIVNIQFLIDNNQYYIEILKKIEDNQKLYLKDFENKENVLKKSLDKIEDSKLILNQNEINLQIDSYNNELAEYKNLVEEFNSHFQYQIIQIREIVLAEIIVLLEQYASENNVDLILDSTSYLIASNSLDITEIINNKLSKINLKLEFDNFEKN